MEQLKRLFDEVIAYCADVPFHAVTLIVIAAFTVAAAVALVCAYARKRKTQTDAPVQEDAPIQAEPATEQAPIEKAPIEEATIEEAPAPAEETKPVSAPKPKKPAVSKTSEADKEKNKTTASKEGTMLLDELKDINTDLDFYEEDETDKMARYSGKWTICRVVTNDAQNLDMYFFELHSSNGEKLLSSEEYTNYNAAVRGVETHKSNILRSNFRLVQTKNGEYTYKLLNGKGMLLCMGEVYETKEACERAMELAKRFARTAFIDENILDVVVKMPEETEAPLPALPDGFNGKWVIDSRESVNGEKVFFFQLLSETEEVLLSSEEFSSYIGTVNSIQTHKTNIKNGNFRILLTKQGDYVYKLLNGNKQLLCLGDHYRTKRLCERAVEIIKKYAAHSPVLTDPELMKEEE